MSGVILASGSPRRKMLLEGAGIVVKVESADIDERRGEGVDPSAYARRMATGKARRVAMDHGGEDVCILGADTIVVHDGRILGKPASESEAYAMLKSLSGCAHTVMTGVCVIDMGRDGTEHCFVTETRVHFAAVGDRRLRAYVATGEPMDKAGAYGIQGGAAGFVSHIEGSYTNVVGLPLCETLGILERLGYA